MDSGWIFFQLTLAYVTTVVARFGGYPSDYVKNHDWGDLMTDYKIARWMNKKEKEAIKKAKDKGS